MSKKLDLLSVQSILFYLIPISLLTGPFLPDLFISLISIIFIYGSIRDRRLKYFTNYFFYIFILFYVLINISAFLSDFIIFSFESSFFYFRFGIFSLAVWYLIDSNKKLINFFTISLLITFMIALCDGYSQYFFNHHLYGLESYHEVRLSLTFDDKMFLGGYLVRMMPLLIGLLIYQINETNKKSTYLFISLILILTDILIFITGERTALGLLILTTLFIIFFLRNFRILRILTFVISIMLIVLISFLSPEIKTRNVDHTLNQVGITDNSRLVIFSPQHESHIFTAYEIFLDNVIFGSGPNTFRHLCNNEKYKYNELSCSTHPHQVYVQAISEVGILGFIVFLLAPAFLLFLVLRETWSRLYSSSSIISDYQICIIAAIGISFWPLLPTLNLFNNWINIVYYLPVGFLLHSLLTKVKKIT